jgi:hypothetical protein
MIGCLRHVEPSRACDLRSLLRQKIVSSLCGLECVLALERGGRALMVSSKRRKVNSLGDESKMDASKTKDLNYVPKFLQGATELCRPN